MRLFSTVALFVSSLAGFAQAADGDLSLNKPFYTAGERIDIFVRGKEAFHGGGQITIKRGGQPVLQVVLEDITVSTDTNAPDPLWSWNQRNEWGHQVRVGTYTLTLEAGWSEDDDEYLYHLATTFEIVPRGTGLIVRTTKTEYDHGSEEVWFYALNRTSRNRSMPSDEPWQITANGRVYGEPTDLQGDGPVRLPARGGRMMWMWNQRGYTGIQAPEGRYTLRLTLGTVRSPEHIYRSFRIVAAD